VKAEGGFTVKNETKIEAAATTPAVFKILPEDHFLKRMADLHELIARRAYELFAKNGFRNGHEIEDWLRAESQFVNLISMEVSETEVAVLTRAALPGYSAKDIEIHVQPRHVFITARPRERSEKNGGKTFYSEQRAKQLFGSIELLTEIDPEKVRARFNNGELQIDLLKVKIGQEVAAAAKAAA
jgi:HSP20 family molecular chaperone IbpA